MGIQKGLNSRIHLALGALQTFEKITPNRQTPNFSGVQLIVVLSCLS